MFNTQTVENQCTITDMEHTMSAISEELKKEYACTWYLREKAEKLLRDVATLEVREERGKN